MIFLQAYRRPVLIGIYEHYYKTIMVLYMFMDELPLQCVTSLYIIYIRDVWSMNLLSNHNGLIQIHGIFPLIDFTINSLTPFIFKWGLLPRNLQISDFNSTNSPVYPLYVPIQLKNLNSRFISTPGIQFFAARRLIFTKFCNLPPFLT